MNIAAALPIGISAASLAAGTIQSTAENFFSMFGGDTEEETTADSTEASQALDTLLNANGQLNAQTEDIRDELKRLLSQFEDVLRRSAHGAGIELPDSYQLRFNPDGSLQSDSNDPFSEQVKALLGNSQEASSLLANIAAQTTALKAATDQARFAQAYNENPDAAVEELSHDQQKRSSLNVTFVGGEAASYQLVSV
ncbi:hypothetical protein [Blastopirellula marina]|uniref:Flagellin N-terminal domain-containing protein n=1 Tax=Blastopirellula marina TaxID=124 RepID=A0A2S8G1M8_9BACT|nr:hypothetical protein [Blastopirellula marina]PQO38348.1 hypothetical protein C5Y98_09790 [Blastopirellula marina]PTL45004.1 hypothetical protein C5Y97_09795 [Blastopirellula marina]